jgi:hypothetical protein
MRMVQERFYHNRRLLTYATLTYADVCVWCRSVSTATQTYADVCYADVCWRMRMVQERLYRNTIAVRHNHLTGLC